MVSKIKHIGTVRIGSEDYKLVETDDQQAWQEQYLHEPPWSEGLPPMLSEPSETWHLGGFKSRSGIPGTSEYGVNTDARFPFRLLPGPEVKTVTLTGATGPITSIFEALGYIWAVGGRHVFRIDPATDAIVDSKDFGATVKGVEGLRWESDSGLVTTDEADQSLWEVTVIGTPDTWTQAAAGVKPYRQAAGIDRLFGIQSDGLLRNVVSGLNPLATISWADRIQCGDTSTKPNSLVAFEKTVLAGKPEGLFAVSPEGKGIPLIKRMIRDDDNCLGMAVHEPYVIVPHSRGVYRFLPGLVESVGLEKELLNESPIKGRFNAFVTDNQWLNGLISVGAINNILVARDRASGEPGFGPLIWDTWVSFIGTKSQAMYLSALSATPRIWFAKNNDIAYIVLTDSAGAPDVDDAAYRFVTAGSIRRFTNKYTFGDWGSKDFPKIVLVGKNLTAARFWDILFSIDGGAFSNLDIDGNGMRIDSDGRKTFFLPLTAVGREVQYRFDYTGDVNTQAGELNFFEPFAVPQSRKIPVNVIQLHLSRDTKYDVGQEARSAAEQLSDLTVLNKAPAPLKASGPWGEDKDMWVRSLRLISVLQEPDLEAEYLVEVSLQEREVS
ncbi:hypothetical protein LCGC14_0876390 [marine sediment metagenome]|uniref:Uncharacterized protein n=1 Tax=marine sediment metagenome TaxID=412755 RepID=A0A0F9P883_9ZZZZ